jgi:hypothetical protein
MQASIKNNVLTISIPLTTPTPSASGKTLSVASSKGNKVMADVLISGKPITIGLNAYIKP